MAKINRVEASTPTAAKLPDDSNQGILGTLKQPTESSPRWIITIDDEIWPGIAFATIDYSGFNTQGSYTLDGIYSLLANTTINGKADPKSQLAKILTPSEKLRHEIKIHVGYSTRPNPSPEDLDLVFVGVVDEITIDWANNAVEITGRDNSALLQDTFTHQQIRNTTAGQFVKQIAENEGIEIGEIQDSNRLVATLFGDEYIGFESVPSEGFNNWELLVKLANYDGYKVFFHQGKLYYVPFEWYKDVIRFEWGSNINSLVGKKNYSVANSRVSVEVLSVDSKAKEAVIASVGPTAKSGSKGDRVHIRLVQPGIDPASAGVFAEGLALIYSQFEYIVTLGTTGAPQQGILNRMRIAETGTDFSRTYRIIHMSWKLGMNVGWQVELNGIDAPDDVMIETFRKRQSSSIRHA